MNNVELDDELLDPVSGVIVPAPTKLTLVKESGRVTWLADSISQRQHLPETAYRMWIWSLRP